MHGELAKGMPKFNADKYQTTIHLHVLGPGSFPELPIFQKYISNINLFYKQIHFIWYMFIKKQTNKQVKRKDKYQKKKK